MIEFQDFTKIARFSRDIVITEKIDGSNMQINIVPKELAASPAEFGYFPPSTQLIETEGFYALAGGRNGYLPVYDANSDKWHDSFGFHQWVRENIDELLKLGPGRHFGEWWGKGVNRGYGLDHRRFSLFNVARWGDPAVRPACCDIVPILYHGPMDSGVVENMIVALKNNGSYAAPGFMRPEGIVIYHTAADVYFKKTVLKDEIPKGMVQPTMV